MSNEPIALAVPALRPLRLGELLDQAIRLYRRNFLTFMAILAVPGVPLIILQQSASYLMTSSLRTRFGGGNPFFNTAYWLGIGLAYFVIYLRVILVDGFANGALANVIGNQYMGKKIGFVDAYRGIGPRSLTLLGSMLLLTVFGFIVLIWWIIPCIGWFTGFGIFMFLGSVVTLMIAPVVVLENNGAVDSLRRVWSLARRRFWWLMGYVFVLLLFSQVVVTGPVLLGGSLITVLLGQITDPSMSLIVTTILQGLIALTTSLLYEPLQLTAISVVYLDLRVRTEGLDLALSTMGDTPASAENPMEVFQAPPLDPSERLITGTDLGNFAILTFGAIGLYILFVAVIAVFFGIVGFLAR